MYFLIFIILKKNRLKSTGGRRSESHLMNKKISKEFIDESPLSNESKSSKKPKNISVKIPVKKIPPKNAPKTRHSNSSLSVDIYNSNTEENSKKNESVTPITTTFPFLINSPSNNETNDIENSSNTSNTDSSSINTTNNEIDTKKSLKNNQISSPRNTEEEFPSSSTIPEPKMNDKNGSDPKNDLSSSSPTSVSKNSENGNQSPNSPNKNSPSLPKKPIQKSMEMESTKTKPVKLSTFSEIPLSSKKSQNEPPVPPKPKSKVKVLVRSFSVMTEETHVPSTSASNHPPRVPSYKTSFIGDKLNVNEKLMSTSPSTERSPSENEISEKLNSSDHLIRKNRSGTLFEIPSQKNDKVLNFFDPTSPTFSAKEENAPKSQNLESISARLLNYICIFGSLLREKDFKSLEFTPEEIYHCIWAILKKARLLNQNFSEVDVLNVLDSVENIISFNKQLEDKKKNSQKGGFISFLIPKNKPKNKRLEK